MTAFENTKTSKGRHPLLKLGTTSNDIYNHLKTKPGATTAEIANDLAIPYYTAKANVTRLKNQGLVANTGKTKNDPYSGRPGKCLIAVPENEGGYARDKVELIVTFYVNDFGEYSAVAKIKGQMPTALEDNPQLIHTIEQSVNLPKRGEFKVRLQVPASEDDNSLVIEGEVVSNRET
jgi:hypothetical protein